MTHEATARAHRRAAVLALYQLDAGRHDDPNSVRDGLISVDLPAEARRKGLAAAHDVWTNRETLDARIETESTDWPVHRQPAVDRAILRLATWELEQGESPPAVILEEAVRMAHEFGTERSAGFVNAILDALAHPPDNPPATPAD